MSQARPEGASSASDGQMHQPGPVLILPRYLFRFSSAKELVPDNVGTELLNLKAAHLHAVELIDKTVRFMSDVSDWRGWRIIVTDVTEQPLFTVLFPCRGRQSRKVLGRRSSEKRLASRQSAVALDGSRHVKLDEDAGFGVRPQHHRS